MIFQFFRHRHLEAKAKKIIEKYRQAGEIILNETEITFFEKLGISPLLLSQLNEGLTTLGKNSAIARHYQAKDWYAIQRTLAETDYDEVYKTSKQFENIIQALRKFHKNNQEINDAVKEDFGSKFKELLKTNQVFVTAKAPSSTVSPLEDALTKLSIKKEYLEKHKHWRTKRIAMLNDHIEANVLKDSMTVSTAMHKLKIKHRSLRTEQNLSEAASSHNQVLEEQISKIGQTIKFLGSRIKQGILQPSQKIKEVKDQYERQISDIDLKLSKVKKKLDYTATLLQKIFTSNYIATEKAKLSLKEPKCIKAMNHDAKHFLEDQSSHFHFARKFV